MYVSTSVCSIKCSQTLCVFAVLQAWVAVFNYSMDDVLVWCYSRSKYIHFAVDGCYFISKNGAAGYPRNWKKNYSTRMCPETHRSPIPFTHKAHHCARSWRRAGIWCVKFGWCNRRKFQEELEKYLPRCTQNYISYRYASSPEIGISRLLSPFVLIIGPFRLRRSTPISFASTGRRSTWRRTSSRSSTWWRCVCLFTVSVDGSFRNNIHQRRVLSHKSSWPSISRRPLA